MSLKHLLGHMGCDMLCELIVTRTGEAARVASWLYCTSRDFDAGLGCPTPEERRAREIGRRLVRHEPVPTESAPGTQMDPGHAVGVEPEQAPYRVPPTGGNSFFGDYTPGTQFHDGAPFPPPTP